MIRRALRTEQRRVHRDVLLDSHRAFAPVARGEQRQAAVALVCGKRAHLVA